MIEVGYCEKRLDINLNERVAFYLSNSMRDCVADGKERKDGERVNSALSIC